MFRERCAIDFDHLICNSRRIGMYEISDKPSDRVSEAVVRYDSMDDLDDIIKNLEKEMKAAADELEFEKAAELRDQIEAIKKMIVFEL